MPCCWEGNHESCTDDVSQTSVVYLPTGSRPNREGRRATLSMAVWDTLSFEVTHHHFVTEYCVAFCDKSLVTGLPHLTQTTRVTDGQADKNIR